MPQRTLDYLQSIIEYDPARGPVWKVSRQGRSEVGKPVRDQIRLDGRRVYIWHVVWFMHHGYWPSERGEWIDHADGNRRNNTIENLRVATPSQNNMNRRGWTEKVHPKGVAEVKGRYRAAISHMGERFFLGSFDTPEEASAAYQGASRVLQGEFSFYNRSA